MSDACPECGVEVLGDASALLPDTPPATLSRALAALLDAAEALPHAHGSMALAVAKRQARAALGRP